MHALIGVARLNSAGSGVLAIGPGRGTRPKTEQTSGPASGGAFGLLKKDAVLDPALCLTICYGFESGSGRDQVRHFGDRLLLTGRCGSVLTRLRLDLAAFC